MSRLIEIPEWINDDRIGDAFNHLFKIISQIEEADTDEFELDFSNNKRVTPFFILPLMLYANSCHKKISCINKTDYLNVIHFGEGLLAEKSIDFSEQMSKYKNKTYIPIVNFPASRCLDGIKENVISVINVILKTQLNFETNIKSGISYLIDEAVNNITDHSNAERGYIFAQYYQAKKYIDLCIADTGITILGSYLKNHTPEVNDDLQALQCALTGLSTKNLPEAENRGYGLQTSKKMLTKGLGGVYFLLSGGAFHVKNSEKDDYIKLPPNIMWKGTIVALRIPYNQNEKFSVMEYVS